jgi:hypothetical protein
MFHSQALFGIVGTSTDTIESNLMKASFVTFLPFFSSLWDGIVYNNILKLEMKEFIYL